MELWLKILIGILVSLGIISLLILIRTLRRINIVFKKIDYISEDVVYKTEALGPTIEALKNFSKYIVLVQNLIDEGNNPNQAAYIKANKQKLLALANYLTKIANTNVSANDDDKQTN